MSSSISNGSNFGSFIPTTSSWEIEEIQSSSLDPKLKELLVRLYQNMNNMAIVVNTKDSALYDTQEFVTGGIYFPNPIQSQPNAMGAVYRQVFRKVINFGPLPNAGTISVYHQIPINSGYSLVGLKGAATTSNTSSMIPLPFSSPTLNQNIKVEITPTQINITTAIDYSAYTTTYLVLEYLKQ